MSSSALRNDLDEMSARKQTLNNSSSLITLKKMEFGKLKRNYLDDDVIALDNVKQVVNMMQSVESALHYKYDHQKAGLQRSVDMQDAQAELAH